MRTPKSRYALACIALLVVLAAVVFLNDLGHFNTDIKPEVYLAPWHMIGQYLSSWTATPYLGSANFNVGLVPVLLPLAALRALGLSPEMTFKIFHFALWAMAAWGANRLTRAVVPKSSKWMGLAAGVFYLANPYTITAGNTLAIALPMAFLPWLILCYVRGLGQPRSWGWPALFGLTFFAMSGMNVAVVPLLQLLALVPIAIVARWQRTNTWGQIIAVTAKCGLFVIAVSVYWLVPGIAALATGSQVVDISETLTGIHKVSSLTEVLRGLGLWPLYGHSDAGPWVAENAVYLTAWPVILLTALWPALALVSARFARTTVRRTLVLMAAMAALIMVGLYPGEGSAASPLGWVLQSILKLGPMAAFRTTNKIGALLALAFSLSLAFGAVWAVRALRRAQRGKRSGVAPVAGAMALVVGVAWVLPAVAGGLYVSRLDVPKYWHQAADGVNSGNKNASVLMLPGQTRPTYRWSVQRPDDLTNSLFTRDAVIPETSPNASAPGANFLAALDDNVQNGVDQGPFVSTMARYLGSSDVLLRHDTVWETDGGVRPSAASNLLSNDKGLFGMANYGQPGQNVLSPTEPTQGFNEGILPPLQYFGVKDARTSVRAESLSNGVVVAGDGWSFPEMTSAGVLSSTPTVRYAHNMSSADLVQALKNDSRLVITDTNARRNAIPQRLTAGEGSLLAADEPLTNSRTLSTDSANQTVLLRSGTLVKATSSGGTFFDLPYAVPENAFDGDPETSWRFGDFRRAPGQKITLTLPSAEKLGDVTIAQPDLGPVKINEATMTAGGKSVTVKVPDSGHATFKMGNVTANNVTITIKSIRGDGFNLVGISEIGLPGPKAARVARTPLTFTNLYSSLNANQRKQFASAPLDVLLQRVQNTSATGDDSEIALRRVISMPDSRSYDGTAKIRLTSGSVESLYDRLQGYSGDTQATSSDFWFKLPQYRASSALADKKDEGWVPGGVTPLHQWWQVKTAPRDLSTIKVTQAPRTQDVKNKTQWVSRVKVLVDGKYVKSADLKPDAASTISLPEGTRGSTVRLEIEGMSGPKDGEVPMFTHIDTGASLKTTDAGALDESGKNRCLPVMTVDGKPIYMRLSDDRVAGPNDNGTTWSSCTPINLSAGDRRIEQADSFTIDSLNLSDRSAKPAAVPAPTVFEVTNNSASKRSLELQKTTTPTAVVISQSYDARWKATLNGKSLGKPTVIDGFSTGWILPAGSAGTVVMSFGPQKGANIALSMSILALIASLLIVWRMWRNGGFVAPVPHRRELFLREQARRRAQESEQQNVVAWSLGLIAVATFGLGWAGLAGALLAIGMFHGLKRSARDLTWVGAAIIVAGVALFVLTDSSLGEVSADAVASALWPHRVAGVGLVVACVGLLLGHRKPKTRGRPAHGRHEKGAR